MFFFSKNFAKIKNPLFRENFFKLFSNFSKTTQYFFLVVFGPLTRVIKTCFKKIFEKKIGNFSNKKISQLFFFLRKNFARKKFPKDFLYKLARTPGNPLLENRRLGHSTCRTRHSTCKARHSTCKTRHSTCKTRHSTCKTSGRMVPPRPRGITTL